MQTARQKILMSLVVPALAQIVIVRLAHSAAAMMRVAALIQFASAVGKDRKTYF